MTQERVTHWPAMRKCSFCNTFNPDWVTILDYSEGGASTTIQRSFFFIDESFTDHKISLSNWIQYADRASIIKIFISHVSQNTFPFNKLSNHIVLHFPNSNHITCKHPFSQFSLPRSQTKSVVSRLSTTRSSYSREINEMAMWKDFSGSPAIPNTVSKLYTTTLVRASSDSLVGCMRGCSGGVAGFIWGTCRGDGPRSFSGKNSGNCISTGWWMKPGRGVYVTVASCHLVRSWHLVSVYPPYIWMACWLFTAVTFRAPDWRISLFFFLPLLAQAETGPWTFFCFFFVFRVSFRNDTRGRRLSTLG